MCAASVFSQRPTTGHTLHSNNIPTAFPWWKETDVSRRLFFPASKVKFLLTSQKKISSFLLAHRPFSSSAQSQCRKDKSSMKMDRKKIKIPFNGWGLRRRKLWQQLTRFSLTQCVIERRSGTKVKRWRSVVLPRPVKLIGPRVLDPSAKVVALKVATRRRLLHSAG